MTWPGLELDEFSVRNPYSGCVIDDRWIVVRSTAVSGSYGAGDFAIFDADNGTARSFGGLSPRSESGSGGWSAAVGMAAANGHAWTADSNNPTRIERIEPVGGSTAIIATGLWFSNLMSATGDYVFGTNGSWGFKYRISTNVFVSWNVNTVNAAEAGVCCHVSGSTLTTRDAASGATIGTWTLPAAPLTTQVGQAIGSRVYWLTASGCCWHNISAGTIGATAPSPSGIPAPMSAMSWTPGPDGYIYFLSSTGALVVLDPVSGRWATDSLPTARTNRYRVFAASGKIWIPSGETFF